MKFTVSQFQSATFKTIPWLTILSFYFLNWKREIYKFNFLNLLKFNFEMIYFTLTSISSSQKSIPSSCVVSLSSCPSPDTLLEHIFSHSCNVILSFYLLSLNLKRNILEIKFVKSCSYYTYFNFFIFCCFHIFFCITIYTFQRHFITFLQQINDYAHNHEIIKDRSLTNLSRQEIRKYLSEVQPQENMFELVQSLPLPDLLKKFLVYNITL